MSKSFSQNQRINKIISLNKFLITLMGRHFLKEDYFLFARELSLAHSLIIIHLAFILGFIIDMIV